MTSSTWWDSTHADPPRVRSRRGSGHDGVWLLLARVRGGAAGKGGHQCNLASNACAMTSTCLLHLWWWLHSGTWHACFFLSASQPKNPPLCSWRDCSSCGVSLPLPGFPPASLGSTAPRVPSSLCSRCWTPRWFSRQVLSSFAFLVQLAGCAPSSRLPSNRLWRGLLGIQLRCGPPTLVPARIAPSRDRRQKRSLRVDGRYRCGTASSMRSDITGSCPGGFLSPRSWLLPTCVMTSRGFWFPCSVLLSFSVPRWSTCDASLLVRSVGPRTDLVGRWRLAFVLLAAPPPVLLFGH